MKVMMCDGYLELLGMLSGFQYSNHWK